MAARASGVLRSVPNLSGPGKNGSDQLAGRLRFVPHARSRRHLQITTKSNIARAYPRRRVNGQRRPCECGKSSAGVEGVLSASPGHDVPSRGVWLVTGGHCLAGDERSDGRRRASGVGRWGQCCD